MSIMKTACYLLALIGCVSGQFTPQVPYELARRGRIKRISCTVDSSVTLSDTALHWYRQKAGGAVQRILYFGYGASTATIESEFSRRFNAGKKDTTFSLTITDVSDGDAAVYYCALWQDIKVFSSGTRLYVSDSNSKVPKVSVYPVSRLQSNQKSVLLCQARDMFPDLVKFTWQAKDQNGHEVELKDQEIVEQRDTGPEVQITSMLIVDQEKVKSSNFTCSVEHENKMFKKKVDVSRPQQQDEEKLEPDQVPVQTCPTPNEKEEGKEAEDEDEDEGEEQEKDQEKSIYDPRCSLYLFSLMYVMLLVKSVLYFCTASVFVCKRNSANKKTLGGKSS